MAKNARAATCSLLYLLWAILVAWSCSQNVFTKSCDRGWFGSNCQYKCRCGGRTCDQSGVCSDGVCEKGWFGPACQFVDLVHTNTTTATPLWLNDSNADTCNHGYPEKQITVHMSAEFPFTWLRLQVNNLSLLHEFKVTFTGRGKQNIVECRNMRNATVNETTLDIHCDLEVLVQDVILKGDGVKSLCSLYVSGGRNVALRQNTSQSSTYFNDRRGIGREFAAAENAVDGNTDSEWQNKSCTSTNVGDMNPNWTVTLSSAHVINRYVVYNRNNNVERIRGFTLTSFTRNRTMVFNYTDIKTENVRVYTITNVRQKLAVSVVNIQANKTVADGILNLCEVELYGDSACPLSRYGRECERTCNCAVKDESCFVSTGGCPSGCAAGFQGEGCDRVCDFGKYDLGCSSNCSQFCVATNSSRSPCLPSDGACVLGCVSGYQAPKCEHILVVVNGDDSIPVAAVVGSLVAVVVLVMVAVFGVFLWRNRATSRNHLSTAEENEEPVHYEEIRHTELGSLDSYKKSEHKRSPAGIPLSTPNQSTHNTVVENNVNDTVYYNTVSGMN